MAEEPRRSRRGAYKSLQDLQRRAKEVATVEENEAYWGDQGIDDEDDESFNSEVISDKGEVSLIKTP